MTGINRAEHRKDRQRSKHSIAVASEDNLGCGAGGKVLSCHLLYRKNVEQSEIDQEIDCDDRKYSANHRTWNIATGIRNFLRKIYYAGPSVIGVDHRL